MAPLLGYFSLYTTRQSDHFITAAKKSMSRKKNHQLKCFVSPDSTFLLFSCIQNCNETKIIKKNHTIQMSWAYDTGVQTYQICITLILEYIYCIQGNCCPFCFRCQRANLKLCEFQCIQLAIFNHNCVSPSSRGGKTVCKCKSAKITQYNRAKITLCKVFDFIDTGFQDRTN